MEMSKLIESEIADFFAGFGSPGEPDIQSGEAQRLLTDRISRLLAAEEQRASPACYALTDMHGEVYNTHSSSQNAEMYRDLIHQSDDSLTLRVTPLYLHPQQGKAVQVPDENGLLPCPFCGGSASVVDNRLGFYVKCNNAECDATAIGPRVRELQSEQEANIIDWNALEQSAKDKWNRRAAMLTSEPVSNRDELNSPVIPDGWVVLPAEPTQKMMNAWLSEVANWRGHEAGYRQMIAAAPDFREKSNSSTSNFREIPETSTKLHKKCWCHTCRPVTMTDMRFVVCPDCGNKRCPKANDHRNTCSGSNEPGQEGSAYPAAPKPEVE